MKYDIFSTVLYTNEDILLRNSFSESIYLYENGGNSWFSSMESLMRYLNISRNIFKLPGIEMRLDWRYSEIEQKISSEV